MHPVICAVYAWEFGCIKGAESGSPLSSGRPGWATQLVDNLEQGHADREPQFYFAPKMGNCIESSISEPRHSL
jgi:hypothetical protein